MHTTRFRINIHRVILQSKDWKTNKNKNQKHHTVAEVPTPNRKIVDEAKSIPPAHKYMTK